MGKYVMVVQSQAKEGRDDEYIFSTDVVVWVTRNLVSVRRPAGVCDARRRYLAAAYGRRLRSARTRCTRSAEAVGQSAKAKRKPAPRSRPGTTRRLFSSSSVSDRSTCTRQRCDRVGSFPLEPFRF